MMVSCSTKYYGITGDLNIRMIEDRFYNFDEWAQAILASFKLP